MKLFSFFVLLMTTAMVAHAQFLTVFYGENHDPQLYRFRVCIPFNDKAAQAATMLYLYPFPLKCTFYTDSKCDEITLSIKPTTFPANKLVNIPKANSTDPAVQPKFFECRFPL